MRGKGLGAIGGALGGLVFACSAWGEALPPQSAASLNLYGATGLIDMPSAEMQPDGMLTTSFSQFGPITRKTLSFQITPRLSGSFRFLGVSDFNKRFCPPDCAGINQFSTYYDRSFDLRYQLFDEGVRRPAVTIGLQDFVGTGIIAGEYVVATKHLRPNLKVSAGLGWGRLGSLHGIGSPFGTRPTLDIANGGNFNTGQWFRGPMAPFGGVEWQISDNWTAKAEYASDDYAQEGGVRGLFDRRSLFNVGLEYQSGKSFRLGAYYMQGTKLGVAAHFFLNPKERTGGGVLMGAPDPILRRPALDHHPKMWRQDGVQDYKQGEALRRQLAARLEKDLIELQELLLEGETAYVRLGNRGLDAEAQMIGRAARAMTVVLPASVERFVLMPVVEGMAVSQVVIERRDLEALEFNSRAAEGIWQRAQIFPAAMAQKAGYRDAEAYPHFLWALGPYSRMRLFDQKSPFKLGVGLELKARYQLSPGLSLSGSVTKMALSDLGHRSPLPDRKGLQPVRSANYFYDSLGDPAIEHLQMRYLRKLGEELYGRVSFGYLERMFGGISTELLYLPVDRPWALGAELNYTAQRAPNGGLGFTLPRQMYETDGCTVSGGGCGYRDRYRVLTGHISGYFKLANNFHVQLDVGRYLAGDIGATLSVKREFANGWRVGAFVTKTDASAAQFGSGSFDKGITIEMPLAVLLGRPSLKTNTTLLRPFGRDGGQRLDVEGRLYESLRGYRAVGLQEQWGRFWK